MKRRDFLKNISLACLAVKVPLVWKPAKPTGFIGLLPTIMAARSQSAVSIRPAECVTLDDMMGMVDNIYQERRRPFYYWAPGPNGSMCLFKQTFD